MPLVIDRCSALLIYRPGSGAVLLDNLQLGRLGNSSSLLVIHLCTNDPHFQPQNLDARLLLKVAELHERLEAERAILLVAQQEAGRIREVLLHGWACWILRCCSFVARFSHWLYYETNGRFFLIQHLGLGTMRTLWEFTSETSKALHADG